MRRSAPRGSPRRAQARAGTSAAARGDPCVHPPRVVLGAAALDEPFPLEPLDESREAAAGEDHGFGEFARPHTDWLPTEIARDERGPLLTGEELLGRLRLAARAPAALETSMPGVLAAGDVRYASVKRVASAVGEGSIAIQLVQSLFAYERLHSGRPTEARAPGGSASAR